MRGDVRKIEKIKNLITESLDGIKRLIKNEMISVHTSQLSQKQLDKIIKKVYNKKCNLKIILDSSEMNEDQKDKLMNIFLNGLVPDMSFVLHKLSNEHLEQMNKAVINNTHKLISEQGNIKINSNCLFDTKSGRYELKRNNLMIDAYAELIDYNNALMGRIQEEINVRYRRDKQK